jgi:hypothetical protein
MISLYHFPSDGLSIPPVQAQVENLCHLVLGGQCPPYENFLFIFVFYMTK